MNRRKFFGVAGLAMPAATVLSAPTKGSGLRISCVKGDPGEPLYGMANVDGKTFKVLLDGIEQRWFHTADEAEGFVLRDVESPDGGPAYNPMTEEWVQEKVAGSVKIVFDDQEWLAKALKLNSAKSVAV